jgi:hypothetical protein
MTATHEESPDRSLWLEFQQRHRSNSFLSVDPLYALSTEVIGLIKYQLPDFFSAEQEAFEHDLAGTAPHGFFLGRPIGAAVGQPGAKPNPHPFGIPKPLPQHSPRYLAQLAKRPGLTLEQYLQYFDRPPRHAQEMLERLAPALKPGWFADGQTEKTLEALQKLLATFWEASGRDVQDIKAAQEQADKEQKRLRRRQEAYAGWLVVNHQFRKELQSLRTEWESTVAQRGGFPLGGAPEDVPRTTRTPDEPDDFQAALFSFLRRWGLERLLTWELPLPLDPEWPKADANQPPRAREEGLTLFVPWYLLRGRQLDLQRIAERLRFEQAPEHLQDWLVKAEDDDQTGEVTYQRLFWLYRSYELVLNRRFQSACQKHMEKLDQALATVMDRSEDLVKRLRQRLMRALRDIGPGGSAAT